MGAGSSARKLKEVEERMEAEAVARRKIEQELLETRRELERLRESMATTKVINMHTEKAMRWKPCRLKKMTKAANAAWSLTRVLVYHDGENCWVPNHADFRFAVVRDALCELVAGLVPDISEEDIKQVMQYFFFLSRDETHPFHPHSNYWNDMDGLGVHLESVGSKKGAVDTKMKMRMSELGEGSDGSGCGCVVLVIAGDRDFIPELMRLCRQGFYVVLLHRNNVSSTRVIEECCHAAFDCWDGILTHTHPDLSYSTKMVRVPRDIAKAVEKEGRLHLEKGLKVCVCLEGENCFLTVLGSRNVEDACQALRSLSETLVAERVAIPADEFARVAGGQGGTAKNVARAKSVLASKFSCLGEGDVTLWGGDVTSRPPPSSAGSSRVSQTSPSRPGGVNGAVERVEESDMLSCSSPEAGMLAQGTPEKFEGGEECVCVTVPAKLVGPRICGPKRSKLHRLEKESGARISIPKPGTHGKDIQVLSLYGTPAQVEAARSRIEQLLLQQND